MSHGTRERLLIINADDYGYTPGVSEGIRQAHRQGTVSSTSVMMTMPAAVAEIDRLQREAPTLGVGVHLTVTEGRPYRMPHFWDATELSRGLAAVSAADLEAEWRAQIEALLATGVPLTHLDSHHHAAYRHAKALGVLLALARDLGVPVRNPYPLGNAEADALSGAFASAGVRHPHHFFDVFAEGPSTGTLLRVLTNLPLGVTEIMCHPGLVDDELRQRNPTRAHERAAELAALTDPDTRVACDRLGIKLVSFSALAAS